MSDRNSRLKDFAIQVIEVLDKQQEYFRSESKQMETALRSRARLIIQQESGEAMDL